MRHTTQIAGGVVGMAQEVVAGLTRSSPSTPSTTNATHGSAYFSNIRRSRSASFSCGCMDGLCGVCRGRWGAHSVHNGQPLSSIRGIKAPHAHIAGCAMTGPAWQVCGYWDRWLIAADEWVGGR